MVGVSFLSFIFVFSALAQIIKPEGPIKRYEYTNNVQLISGIITQIVILGLLLFLILRLAFGKSVLRFFSKNAIEGESETIESPVSDLIP